MASTFLLILIDDLKEVIMDICLINEFYVLGRAIIPNENLHIVLLDCLALLNDTFVLVCYYIGEEVLPLLVCKGKGIEFLQLDAKIGNKVCLAMDLKILVALSLELLDELLLQFRFALVVVVFFAKSLCGAC